MDIYAIPKLSAPYHYNNVLSPADDITASYIIWSSISEPKQNRILFQMQQVYADVGEDPISGSKDPHFIVHTQE